VLSCCWYSIALQQYQGSTEMKSPWIWPSKIKLQRKARGRKEERQEARNTNQRGINNQQGVITDRHDYQIMWVLQSELPNMVQECTSECHISYPNAP
jgi:hypothetical protein